MDDTLRDLLTDYLDGSLPAAQAREVDELLERDPEARAFVDEHRLVWEALGEALDDVGVAPDPAFRSRVLAQARPQRVIPWARAASLAAAVLVAATLVVWFLQDDGPPALSPEDGQVVRYLHVLDHFEMLDTRGRDLDLRRDLEILRALEDV